MSFFGRFCLSFVAISARSRFLVGSVAGNMCIQVQFGGLRSEWDQIGVGSGRQAEAGGSYGPLNESWKCSNHWFLDPRPIRATL